MFLVSSYIYHRAAADCGSGGGCDIGIRNSDQVGAIWINLIFICGCRGSNRPSTQQYQAIGERYLRLGTRLP